MKNEPYTKNLNTAVFDIETTGLYSSRDRVISASFIGENGENLIQFFAESPEDEPRVLSEILSKLSELDAVITYNGQGFDLPFILARLKKHGLRDRLPMLWSIDLYRWLKTYWPLAKSLEHMRQKDVEEVLGLSEKRTDEISGGECIDLYNRYVKLKDKKAKELILLHNGDDVRQLAKITSSIGFLPFHRIVFEQGRLVKNEEKKILLSGCTVKKNGFSLSASLDPGYMPASFYEDGFRLELDAEGNAHLDVFPSEKQGYSYFDLQAAGLDSDEMKAMAGYYSGYLVLAKDGQPMYREMNALIKGLMMKLFH